MIDRPEEGPVVSLVARRSFYVFLHPNSSIFSLK